MEGNVDVLVLHITSTSTFPSIWCLYYRHNEFTWYRIYSLTYFLNIVAVYFGNFFFHSKRQSLHSIAIPCKTKICKIEIQCTGTRNVPVKTFLMQVKTVIWYDIRTNYIHLYSKLYTYSTINTCKTNKSCCIG